MSPSEKMTSIGKVTPLVLSGLGNLRAQFPLLSELLRFCRSPIHRFHLFVVLLGPNQASISTLARACLFSTLREEFKKYIQPFVDDVAKYGTHSMRSGAASNPACRRIPGDLLDMHAGWRCPSSKNRYIKHTMEDRLSVSKSLLL